MADYGTYIVGAGSLATALVVAVHNWKKDQIAELKQEIAALRALHEAALADHRNCEARYAALLAEFIEQVKGVGRQDIQQPHR